MARRALVDLPALDADQPVLDQVDPADALRAGAGVELGDQLDEAQRDGRRGRSGTPSTKLIVTSSGSRC